MNMTTPKTCAFANGGWEEHSEYSPLISQNHNYYPGVRIAFFLIRLLNDDLHRFQYIYFFCLGQTMAIVILGDRWWIFRVPSPPTFRERTFCFIFLSEAVALTLIPLFLFCLDQTMVTTTLGGWWSESSSPPICSQVHIFFSYPSTRRCFTTIPLICFVLFSPRIKQWQLWSWEIDGEYSDWSSPAPIMSAYLLFIFVYYMLDYIYYTNGFHFYDPVSLFKFRIVRIFWVLSLTFVRGSAFLSICFFHFHYLAKLCGLNLLFRFWPSFYRELVRFVKEARKITLVKSRVCMRKDMVNDIS